MLKVGVVVILAEPDRSLCSFALVTNDGRMPPRPWEVGTPNGTHAWADRLVGRTSGRKVVVVECRMCGSLLPLDEAGWVGSSYAAGDARRHRTGSPPTDVILVAPESAGSVPYCQGCLTRLKRT